MSTPRVWEWWKCRECGTEKMLPYRTERWTRAQGCQVDCKGCGQTEYYDYIRDGTREEREARP
uniref:Uncharacterized protein n=1 Tax=viral metagenome TaxID=1070528 RepID=A0A6H1ZLN9_9ZZZZ